MQRSKAWTVVLRTVAETGHASLGDFEERAGNDGDRQTLEEVVEFMVENDWLDETPTGYEAGESLEKLQVAAGEASEPLSVGKLG